MSSRSVILIGDERVKNIPVQECHEPIIDFSSEFQSLKFDLDRHHVQKQSKSISYGRISVGRKLVEAQSVALSDC